MSTVRSRITDGGIYYDELEGSPTFNIQRDGASATQILLIDWDDITDFVYEMFPSTYATVLGWDVYVPVSFPGNDALILKDLRIEPFDPNNPTDDTIGGDPLNSYASGAKVTAQYETNDWQSATDDDGNELKFSHNISVGAEFLRMPQFGYQWSSDNTPVQQEDALVSKVISTIEHELTFYGIVNPPLRANVYPTVGCVNDRRYNWLFASEAETLLFQGMNAELKTIFDGKQMWDLHYRFTERLVQGEDRAAAAAIGWNHFWREDAGAWDKLVARGGGNRSVYDTADFKDLFRR